MEIFFCLYKIVLCPFSSQLLYFDLFLFATYLFNNLFNYSVSTYVSIIYRKKKIKKKITYRLSASLILYAGTYKLWGPLKVCSNTLENCFSHFSRTVPCKWINICVRFGTQGCAFFLANFLLFFPQLLTLRLASHLYSGP